MFQIKEKIISKENIFCFLLIVVIFLVDRVTKIKIINYQVENTKVIFVNNYLNLDLIWNTGIGFGLLKSNTALFYNLISTLIGLVVIILFFLALRSKSFDKIIYSIIIGGALGNFYDRIVYKAVPDFVDLHYNNFHWFTFNVADIFITIGILIFMLRSFYLKN